MQLRSSMTIMPPEPIMAPYFLSVSKSTGRSSSDSGMQPPEGPPVWMALKGRLFIMPPPMS